MASKIGAYGEKGLQTLLGKGMIEGMSNCTLDFDFFEHCIYGKQNRVRFPSGSTRAKGILELIHSEVFGPVPIPSLGKYMYYVSFIDDYSRNIIHRFTKGWNNNRSKHITVYQL